MKKAFLLIGLFVLCTPIIKADVTVASWGAAYTESQIKAYVDTYSEPGSIKFEKYYGVISQVREQVESGKVEWDVVDVFPKHAITGCDEGLFEDISAEYKNFPTAPDGTGIIEDMANNGVTNFPPCCAPQILWTYVVFYDPDAFTGAKPSTLADFFDTEKFPGKRGVQAWADAIVEMALVADGVSVDAVYKVLKDQTGALDRTFAKLDTIKDDVVFWARAAEPIELVKSGEVVMSIAYNGRVGAANLNEGENFEYIWEGQVIQQEYICLTAGSPNRDEALEFMKWASASEQQAGQAKYTTYGPMRASGMDLIKVAEPWFHTGANVMQHMPNTTERLKNSVMADPVWWSNNGAEIHERYDSWMNN